MNSLSDLQLASLGGIMLAFASMLVVRIGMAVYGHIKYELAYRRHPRVVNYNEDQACKDPHKWQQVTLAVRYLDPGIYKVCLDCGAISGNETVMLSNEALDALQEQIKNADKQKELERLIQARITAIIDRQVTDFINRSFPKESNDPTFVNKLLELSELTLETQERAIEKVSAELELQEDFGTEVEWSDNAKGNA